jgi:hypothetical protein
MTPRLDAKALEIIALIDRLDLTYPDNFAEALQVRLTRIYQHIEHAQRIKQAKHTRTLL